MEDMKEVNKWLSIVHEAWNHLVDDFENFGSKGGYGHMSEEDIRSYLFCKITHVLQRRREWLIDLHTEQPLPTERVDIVVGLSEGKSWIVGIEIKQSGQHKPLRNDLDKLRKFMKDGFIKVGVLAVIAKHEDQWDTLFKTWHFSEEFKLGNDDKGDNNYLEIRNLKEIQLVDETKKWDSLLFVLRKM